MFVNDQGVELPTFSWDVLPIHGHQHFIHLRVTKKTCLGHGIDPSIITVAAPQYRRQLVERPRVRCLAKTMVGATKRHVGWAGKVRTTWGCDVQDLDNQVLSNFGTSNGQGKSTTLDIYVRNQKLVDYVFF